MTEYIVTFMNEPDPKLVLKVLAEITAEREGMMVADMNVHLKQVPHKWN